MQPEFVGACVIAAEALFFFVLMENSKSTKSRILAELLQAATNWKVATAIFGIFLALASIMVGISQYGWAIVCLAGSAAFTVPLWWNSDKAKKQVKVGKRYTLVPRRSLQIIGSGLILLGYGVPVYEINLQREPSYAFVQTGFDIPGSKSWDFVISHRGPRTAFNVDMIFTDERKADANRNAPSATPQDVLSSMARMHYDAIEPKWRGAVIAKQFQWTPFNYEHQHYSVEITSREGSLRESIYVENVSGKWEEAMLITDRGDHDFVLLTCRDYEFPSNVGPEIKAGDKPCFPNVIVNNDSSK